MLGRSIVPLLATSLLLVPLLLASCNAEVSRSGEDLVVDQTSFDFTVVADRALFRQEGLEYFGTVGPYAIYEVTGEDPRLVGPRVRFDSAARGLVMLCGASGYFGEEGSGDVEMKLYGGEDGDEELAGARVEALTVDEGCSQADDRFTDRVPSDDPGEAGEATLHYTSEERIVLGIDGSPAVGSRILIRLAALDVPERDHNNASTIPAICCDEEYCTLEGAE